MNYEEIEAAVGKVKPTDIGKGKDYIEVNQRIKVFRMVIPNGTIETELLSLVDGVAIFKAVVKDENGKVLGTGHAYEKEGNGFINKTSYIENCETSAVGRALAMVGIGIDTSIASKEEVENAKLNQEKAETPKAITSKPQKKNQGFKPAESVEEVSLRTKVIMYFNRHKMDQEKIAKICSLYGVSNVKDLKEEHCAHYIEALKKQGGNIDE